MPRLIWTEDKLIHDTGFSRSGLLINTKPITGIYELPDNERSRLFELLSRCSDYVHSGRKVRYINKFISF
jgi:hypothetical protein